MKVNNIIYITGPDGSGKTTFIKEIEDNLHGKGLKTKHLWLRSPKLLSKPLMAYCRLVGLTKYEVIDGIRYGRHEFYRSKLVSRIFPVLQVIDFAIKWFLIKRKLFKNQFLLVDRFSLDTLSDLMVDTGRMDLPNNYIGKILINFIPDLSNVLVLQTNEQTIKNRKKDTLHDPHLKLKIQSYEHLINELKLSIINNNDNYKNVKEKVFNFFKIETY